ncbi:hypothetical protein SLEP1_g56072 [Rubroshorea leprosula]|uniref:Disease resistance R13L4/SHOC-2-like LRR domain-containing protein n=1 Tax=Rubroshorea leprosula TaxID=152421 RepID=A0AAV5MKK6_9ROSI|nr:hypothetical protein SLEP1_g56072 [Rubroshorea leprosula]
MAMGRILSRLIPNDPLIPLLNRGELPAVEVATRNSPALSNVVVPTKPRGSGKLNPESSSSKYSEELMKKNAELEKQLKDIQRSVDKLKSPRSHQQALDLDSTPFNLSITTKPYQEGFKISHLETYDGSDDPIEHLHTYQAIIKIQNATDAMMCKVLPATLKSIARRWYHKLPRHSIASYSQLATLFSNKFASQREIKQIATELMQIQHWVKRPPPPLHDSPLVDRSKYCDYHCGYGHNIDDCKSLKDDLDFLARNGKLEGYVQKPYAQQPTAVLNALKDMCKNLPLNWSGLDPCGDGWVGIECTDSRVTSITLANMGLEGQVFSEIPSLTELQTLDLSYNKGLTGSLPASIGDLTKLTNLNLIGCGFTGAIPDTIGNLQQLIMLSLNSNRFRGQIPPSIGNLSKLYWLDLADNQLEGPIPVSDGTTPGLDKLFDSNNLSGPIPSTLGLVQSLQVIRFDNNSLSGRFPSNLNNLTSLQDLYLSNNNRSGSLPSLTGMSNLNTLDLSNNSFSTSVIPTWISSLLSLTTLRMENTQLQGRVPDSLFSLPNLQTLIGDNPVCEAIGVAKTNCVVPQSNSTSLCTTPPSICLPATCSSDQVSSPRCGYHKDSKKSTTGIIIGAAVGGSVLLVLSLLTGVYAFCQKRKAERAILESNPFAHWDVKKSNGSIPQLRGARCFSFEELKKYTNNFSEANDIGSRGYGKESQESDWTRPGDSKLPLVQLEAWHIYMNLLILPSYIGTLNHPTYYWISASLLKLSISVSPSLSMKKVMLPLKSKGQWVRMALDKTKDLYNLQQILVPAIVDTSLKGLENFVDLAMTCVEESGANRPTMGKVVKEIENIMQTIGMNPNAESATSSSSYEEASKGNTLHPYSNESFAYSDSFPVSKV